MQSVTEDERIILKLEDGEDLFQCLNDTLKSTGAKALVVELGIGMLRELNIGYFNGKEYEKEAIQDPMELVALHGLVAPDSTHLHCGLADKNRELFGGHLFEAKVNVVNEIALLRLDKVRLRRRLNPSTGLMELQLG